ncbi:hypothetical protein [Streptomyces nigra]|uniref:hypothetical protein n=1 Tax=Streptomyces nigra TaxID=1827580 RepID=UPI00341FF02D
MCPRCEDFVRTFVMLGDLALYAETFGADLGFVEAVSASLAASLPDPPPGLVPPGYDPSDGPDHPGQGS